MSKPKDLTWDELADVYYKYTGRQARIQPMENISNWALSRPDLFTYNNEGFQRKEA